ncbi:hypothetical protein [Piscirickettsia salmonis]|nr:hypothetical protein [Piscirickettsia salmonis]QGN97010.1 hypothetical protein Psal006a_03665 [Piscirickettsia salmonis]
MKKQGRVQTLDRASTEARGPSLEMKKFIERLGEIKPGFTKGKSRDEIAQLALDWENIVRSFPKQVLKAVNNMLLEASSHYAPNPGEYREMCFKVKPEELGYTNTKQAYAECYLNIRQRHKVTQPRHWSHATVFIASEALRAQNYACGISEYRYFEKSYLKAVYRDLNDERLPYPPVVLPMIENKPAKSRQCGSEHLAKLRGALGRPAHA